MSFQGQNQRLLEHNNDNRVDELHGKVSQIKALSILIQDDANSQNRHLDNMSTQFDSAGAALKNTARKLNIMMAVPSNRRMCYMVAGIISIFVITYWAMKS